MKKEDYKKYFGITISLFGAIALSIILFFFIYRMPGISGGIQHLSKVLMPFIIGGCLAYVICPMVNRLEQLFLKLLSFIKDDKKRAAIAFNCSVFGGIIITIIIIYIIIIIIVPNLISSIVKLVQILPANADRLISWAEKILNENEMVMQYSEQVIDKATEFVQNFINDELLTYVQNITVGLSTGVISVFNVLFNVLIGFIVAIYFLMSRKKLARQGKLVVYSIFKKDTADSIMEEVKYADKIFSGFINGKILDSVVVAIICYIGLEIFSFANPGKNMMSEILISVIVGIFNIIPFFGWYIGWFIGALLALMVNPIQCLFFIIFDFILQQIDGNILGPKILGNNTGISSFWVLFAILLFGDIWGFSGMLIGVPLFAVIYHLIKKLVFKGLKRNGQEEMGAEYERDYPRKESESFSENVKNAAEKIHDAYDNYENSINEEKRRAKEEAEMQSRLEAENGIEYKDKDTILDNESDYTKE
ncbi:MAG: AI-2E family transporter [Lachnospira sp.]